MADQRNDLPPVNSPNFLEKVREALSTYLGNRGNKLDRGLTVRDLADAGIIKISDTYRSVPGGRVNPVGGVGSAVGGRGTGYTADLTPPPTPTGFAASAGLTQVFITVDAQTYTQGNGHGVTRLYGSTIGGATFGTSQLLLEFTGTIVSYPAVLGSTYHLWVTNVSKDGVESVAPAPSNDVYGLEATTGKIGNADLNPLIIEAGNLADGSVSATKLAALAIDATKFANGIEPLSVVNTLPTAAGYTGPKLVFLTTDGKLYRYAAGAWTASVAAPDLTGTLDMARIADGSLAGTKFASGIEPITVVTGALPGTKSTSTIFRTDDGKLYRWSGTAYVASIPATDVAGQLTNAQIADIAAAKVSGQLTNAQLADIAATKITGQLTNAQLADLDATKITGTLTNAQIADLAATKVTGQLADSQLANIAAAKLIGTIATSQIANGNITLAKFASGITPVEVLGALPGTGNFDGRQVYLTTDKKLYRHNGTSFSTAVESTDVIGQLSNAQIAAIDAAKVNGQITSTQITDSAITSAKINAGAVVAGKIAAGTIVAGDIAAMTITGAQLAAGAVTAGKIAAGSITAGDIAADTITSGQIAAGAISASELATGAVIAGKIAAGTIVAGDIAALTITGSQLAAGAVTAGKITAGAIVAADIAALTITGANVAAGAITTAKIAANAITANEIAANAVTTTTLAAGAITTAKIAAGAVTAGEIAASAVTATQLSAGAVTAGKIATGAIMAGDIAAGAITTPKLAAGAVTANEIAANTITSGNIASNAITAGKIAAGSITTTELQANGINADRLTAGTITSDRMTVNTINGDRILANTLNADKILANSITAGQIQAGAIGVQQIAAGAITTDKLLVTGKGAALNDDPYTLDLSAWSFTGATLVTDTTCPVGTSAIQTSSNTWGTSRRMTLDAARNYQYRFWVKGQAGTCITYGMVQFFDAAGSVVYMATGWGSVGTYNYFGLVGDAAPAGWTEYVISFGPGETAKIPAGAKTFAVGAILNYNGSVSPTSRVAGLRVFEKAAADMIVDGSISATKLSAGAIAVGSAAIQNGAIVNAMIGDATIDSAKIANLSVDKLTAGAMQVGSHLRSTSYVPGSSGWKINADGTAEFANAVIRGAVYATSGYLQGLEVRNASGQVLLSSGNTANEFFNSAIVVGGKNLMRYSGQFLSASGWGSNGATVSLDTAVKYGDSNTLKLVGLNGAVNNNIMRLKANTEYTVSAMVKGSSALAGGQDSHLHIQVWCTEDAGNVHQDAGIAFDQDLLTVWKRVYQTFKTPDSADLCYCRFYFYPLATNYTLNVGYVKLEEGNKATDWTPAPEDVADDATAKADAAVVAAAAAAQAKADLAKTQANAYADGIVTTAEAAAIAAAQTKADAAQLAATNAAAADATAKANVAATTANWSGVSNNDGNRPANGATVGAPANTYVGGTLAQTVESNASTALTNSASALTGLGSRLSKSGADTLSGTISINATSMAGIRVSPAGYVLEWDAAGNRTTGAGVAITPGGIMAHNGSKTTFNISGSSGNATFGGTLDAASGTFSGTVSGGQFTTGAYTGYAWPAVNNYGTYLGPSGLMIGNANNSKYFQVTQDGNLSAPGFSIVNGTMSITALNVIGTLNIAGNSVTISNSASGGNGTATNVVVPSGVTMKILCIAYAPSVWTGGSINEMATLTLGLNGVTYTEYGGWFDSGTPGHFTDSLTIAKHITVTGPVTVSASVSETFSGGYGASALTLALFGSMR